MSKYLIKTQEQWRVDSESEAKALIEEAKNEKTSILAKYSSEYKEHCQRRVHFCHRNFSGHQMITSYIFLVHV